MVVPTVDPNPLGPDIQPGIIAGGDGRLIQAKEPLRGLCPPNDQVPEPEKLMEELGGPMGEKDDPVFASFALPSQ
jgi:hypothetical protein